MIVEHEISRRILGLAALSVLACAFLWSAQVAAQDDRPQIMPSEHKLPTKKDLGPRALAILQVGEKGKTSLVPIAIMIDGKFWDASAYKADPVPMALESGTVYEVERDGSSQGLFTVGSALHSNAVNAPVPWLATGSWVPAGTETKSTVMTARAVPLGLTDTDAPPRLTRDPTKVYPENPAASGPAPSSPSPGGSSDGPPRLNKPEPSPSSSPSSSGSGDEPPRLSKPASSSDSQPSSSGQTGSGQTSTNSSTAPAKSGSAKASTQENVPVDDSGAGAADRPLLRRGKPSVSFADEDFPGYSKPGATPSTKPAATAAARTPSLPDNVQLIPAISDAHGPQPHSYVFEWLTGEESQRHDQMLDLAKQQLASYLKAQAKEEITPQAHASRTSHREPAKKMPEPILENVKMIAYDLWLSNQPVIVFSADAHMPPGAQTGEFSNLTYSIVIVGYPDIYNNVHKLYVGVTDKYHLDVTPRLDLIDAVDADGDGRGELLFRETSDAGTGWVVYRASADSLWKMYDSLNPE